MQILLLLINNPFVIASGAQQSPHHANHGKSISYLQKPDILFSDDELSATIFT